MQIGRTQVLIDWNPRHKAACLFQCLLRQMLGLFHGQGLDQFALALFGSESLCVTELAHMGVVSTQYSILSRSKTKSARIKWGQNGSNIVNFFHHQALILGCPLKCDLHLENQTSAHSSVRAPGRNGTSGVQLTHERTLCTQTLHRFRNVARGK